jgi:hypothetical protein
MILLFEEHLSQERIRRERLLRIESSDDELEDIDGALIMSIAHLTKQQNEDSSNSARLYVEAGFVRRYFDEIDGDYHYEYHPLYGNFDSYLRYLNQIRFLANKYRNGDSVFVYNHRYGSRTYKILPVIEESLEIIEDLSFPMSTSLVPYNKFSEAIEEGMLHLPVPLPDEVKAIGVRAISDALAKEESLLNTIRHGTQQSAVLAEAELRRLRRELRIYLDDYGLTFASFARIRRQLGLS